MNEFGAGRLSVRPPSDRDGWRIVGGLPNRSGVAVLELSETAAFAVDPTEPTRLIWAVADDDDAGRLLIESWLGSDLADQVRHVGALVNFDPPTPTPVTHALGQAALCAHLGGADDPTRWGLWCADLLDALSRADWRIPIPYLAEIKAEAAAVLAEKPLRLRPDRSELLALAERLASAPFRDRTGSIGFEDARRNLDIDSGYTTDHAQRDLHNDAFDMVLGRPTRRPDERHDDDGLARDDGFAFRGPTRGEVAPERELSIVDAVRWIDVGHTLGARADSTATISQHNGHGALVLSHVTRPDSASKLVVRVLGVSDDGECAVVAIGQTTFDPAGWFTSEFDLQAAGHLGFNKVLVEVVTQHEATEQPGDLHEILGRAISSHIARAAVAARSGFSVEAILSLAGEALVDLGDVTDQPAGRSLARSLLEAIDLGFLVAAR